MNIKEYLHIIFGVLKDLRVIGTVLVCLLVIEFAKYVTTYRKKPPKPKKGKKVAAPSPAPTEAAATENAEESAE